MKTIRLISALFISGLALTAEASTFQVVCGGSVGYGANNGSDMGMKPQLIARNVNDQLNEIAKTKTITNVTAPIAATGAGAGASTNGDSHAHSQIVCVTVTMQ